MGALNLALALLAAQSGADPVSRWQPLIAEAAQRCGVPEPWIARVLHAESGGRTMVDGSPIRSPKGAMGLMQLMPATWAEMRAALGLGGDPDDPRDNIVAGAWRRAYRLRDRCRRSAPARSPAGFLTMAEKVRHQLFLPKAISDRLEVLAAKPGASKSAILADAVTAWLNRRGASELEDKFALRLDRMTKAIGRVERDGQILLETLALFVRYELAIHAPLAENDAAGRALAAKRFEAFIAQVGRQLASGRRTIALETEPGQ